MHLRLALLPGDGIGPEVVDAAVAVLQAVARRFGHTLDLNAYPIGGAAMDRGGPPLPDETLNACLAADAVLLGAVGDPKYDGAPRERKPETALLGLRSALGVYANLRPARLWPGLLDVNPFRPERVEGADLLIVRELTGGLYFGEPRGFEPERTGAWNTLRYTVHEIERVADVAFRLAAARSGRLTSVDKANVLEVSQLWREVVTRKAAEHPAVKLDHLYVDACAMLLSLDPKRFDVILTENLFGDILSDQAAAIAGSLGLLPSASLGSGPALYEPVHGSAPTLAGKDQANPVGAIASIALLLRHTARADVEADAVEAAIGSALADGLRTADIVPPGVPPVSCSALAKAIAERAIDV